MVWNQNLIGFVASVVDASEDKVHIIIRTDNNSLGSDSGSGACGDSVGHKLTPGWPQVYTYVLDEANNRGVSGPVVVDLDGDQIFSQRIKGMMDGEAAAVWKLSILRHDIGFLRIGWESPNARCPGSRSIPSLLCDHDNTAYQSQLGKIIESGAA